MQSTSLKRLKRIVFFTVVQAYDTIDIAWQVGAIPSRVQQKTSCPSEASHEEAELEKNVVTNGQALYTPNDLHVVSAHHKHGEIKVRQRCL